MTSSYVIAAMTRNRPPNCLDTAQTLIEVSDRLHLPQRFGA